MKVFIVTVKPGDLIGRYFDSIWIVESHAEERATQLRDELRRSGFDVWATGTRWPREWVVTVTTAQAADGQLATADATKAGA